MPSSPDHKALRRQELTEHLNRGTGEELDSTYAHLRAVIENVRGGDLEALRHQLVGLLPEVRGLDPELKRRMLEKDMTDAVELAEQRVREGWAQYGYGDPDVS